LGVWTRSSALTSTPCFAANPLAAGVGVPSGLNPAETGGPFSSSSRSVWRSGIRTMRTVRRRGVLNVSTADSGGSRCSRNCVSTIVPI
jgi:hypothetical protein